MRQAAEVISDDGHRLWAEAVGSGPPIILCHGGPGLWDMFGDLAEMLADIRTVHRWDQRGCGRSQPGGPYTLHQSVEDLDAARRHFGHERVDVLGHSWGATLALRYALDHPDRVSRLVYLSGTGLSASSWRDEFHAALARRRSPAEDSAGEREAAIVQWEADFVDRAWSRQHAEAMATPWFPINYEANRAINKELKRSWREDDLIEECRRLTVPTLILEGSEDLRPRWAVDSLAAALPNCRRTTLDGVGHVPWLEASDRTASALRAFLGDP